MLDSVNLNNTPYSDEMLLSSPLSFPAQERFTTEVTPDTNGFFFLQKPTQGKAFQLLSFYVSGDRYGKGKITITSPNPLELWIDNVKRATKIQVNDSLHQSGQVDANLNGFTNNARIVIKLLTSADNKIDPAVKIELKPDEADSLLTYTFGNSDRRRIQINDILEGKGWSIPRYLPVAGLCYCRSVRPFPEVKTGTSQRYMMSNRNVSSSLNRTAEAN